MRGVLGPGKRVELSRQSLTNRLSTGDGQRTCPHGGAQNVHLGSAAVEIYTLSRPRMGTLYQGVRQLRWQSTGRQGMVSQACHGVIADANAEQEFYLGQSYTLFSLARCLTGRTTAKVPVKGKRVSFLRPSKWRGTCVGTAPGVGRGCRRGGLAAVAAGVRRGPRRALVSTRVPRPAASNARRDG